MITAAIVVPPGRRPITRQQAPGAHSDAPPTIYCLSVAVSVSQHLLARPRDDGSGRKLRRRGTAYRADNAGLSVFRLPLALRSAAVASRILDRPRRHPAHERGGRRAVVGLADAGRIGHVGDLPAVYPPGIGRVRISGKSVRAPCHTRMDPAPGTRVGDGDLVQRHNGWSGARLAPGGVAHYDAWLAFVVHRYGCNRSRLGRGLAFALPGARSGPLAEPRRARAYPART